jgi:hypothetical protein
MLQVSSLYSARITPYNVAPRVFAVHSKSTKFPPHGPATRQQQIHKKTENWSTKSTHAQMEITVIN